VRIDSEAFITALEVRRVWLRGVAVKSGSDRVESALLPRSLWHWLAPALLALALYAITVPGTYVYDDQFVARRDPRLYDPHKWRVFLREGYFEDSVDKLWRPLVSLTFAIEAWGHGDRIPGPATNPIARAEEQAGAWPFHLVNVLLHASASALVAALGAKLLNRRVGLLAGLLFAAHPVHVEAVAGIVGRSELMLAIGVLAALNMFIGKPLTIARAFAIAGWFLFAALSKEQGMLLPAILAAWMLLGRWEKQPAAAGGESPGAGNVGLLDYSASFLEPTSSERRAGLVLIFLLLTSLAAYISYHDHVAKWYWERGFLDPMYNPLIASRGADRWLILIAIFGRYIGLLFAPWRLAIDYSANVFTPRLDLHEPYFYIGLIGLAVVVFLAGWAWRRRSRAAMFCLIGFGIASFMASNIFLIGTIFGERLMYLPSVFFCTLIAMGLSKLRPSKQIITMSIALTLAAIRTITYGYEWNDRLRLYNYAHRQQPKGSMIYLLLAGEFGDRGDIRAADRVLDEGRRVCPEASQMWLHAALTKIKLGDLDEAERFARKSLRLRPVASAEGVLREIDRLRQNGAATKP
jgi:hypothetical protein